MNMQLQHPRLPFESTADFLAAVAHHATEHQLDPRLDMQAGITGMGTTTATVGFLMPEDQTEDIWQRAYNVGNIMRRCTAQPMSPRSSSLVIPTVSETSRSDGSRFGGMALAWLDEGEPFPEFKLKFDKGLRLFSPRKIGGLVAVTDELLADAPALTAFFERASGMEVAFMVESAIVDGDGVGQPLGILQAPATIEVAPEAGQAPGTLQAANFSQMIKRFWMSSFPKAAWLMGVNAYAAILELEAEEGIELIKFVGGVPTLHGFAVIITEVTNSLGSRGDIILCDLSQYLLVEREAGTHGLSSIHVKFVQDETAFRLRARIEGAPAWSSPVTVKNAPLPVSPFVVLGART
jgi:HK97 family phage major capsid protein